MKTAVKEKKQYVSSRNACKLCSPLGASLVFRGIEGCIPMIHGSQGCATYIRRYMISHFKEPMDIASSNFSEESTIYGGNKNFVQGINNVRQQYSPLVMGIASTCLSETIGEDVPSLIAEYKQVNENDSSLPVFIYASTPSYQGTHIDGFHEAVLATVKTLARYEKKTSSVNLFSGFISPADIRILKEILEDYDVDYTLFPDYSDSLDNTFWNDYLLIPKGGTPINKIVSTANAKASIEFGTVLNKGSLTGRVVSKNSVTTAGKWLEDTFFIENHQIMLPIGIDATSRFLNLLTTITGKQMPKKYEQQRGRLIDSYIDSHKYVFGKKALVYGEEDFVIALCSFLSEIGIDVVIAASGGESNALQKELDYISDESVVIGGADFETMRELALKMRPDIVIGNSKGYYIARELNIPLVRVGFPIHDRVGGARIKHLCYEGTQQLFDNIVNSLLEYKQENSPVGYKYM